VCCDFEYVPEIGVHPLQTETGWCKPNHTTGTHLEIVFVIAIYQIKVLEFKIYILHRVTILC